MSKLAGKTTEEMAKSIEETIGQITASTDETLTKREAILAVLARAADEPEFLARLRDNPHEALREYYTLTWEERAALASGDIKKVEGWVGKLDARLATWLWCRLSQAQW